MALVDGLAADGVITQGIKTVSTNKSGRLIFRYVDESNYYSFAWSEGAGNYRVYKYKAGVLTQAIGTSTQSADGDVISVTLNGSFITPKINGSVVGTVTDSDFSTATIYGMLLSATDYGTAIESMSFVATP